MITICYFARLREALGIAKESLELKTIDTVAALRDHLIDTRGEEWSILKEESVRVAINHQLAELQASIADGDEVAFFPPVTGG